jgi:putative nucleotidyltransferase with HDIG domain
LQRKLQREALGTYQHTLSVANLVEAAAEAIGADSLLARVGTLYHDIGKTANPGFFVENRTEGSPDPHEGLGPLASARIIRAHVTDGIDLARRYRLPPRVIDFIQEHHGTLPILYFLHQAQEEARAAGITLDERPYYYGGPTPRSPETAILMLADGCESAVRANRVQSAEEIESVVGRMIRQRVDSHQLDRSGLTLTQLQIIQETFVRTLRGMYHPRVRYPDERQPASIPLTQADMLAADSAGASVVAAQSSTAGAGAGGAEAGEADGGEDKRQ